MKKLNLFAIAASIFLLAACGEQTRENQNYDTEPMQESPSDVYNEGEIIEEEPVEDPAFDMNENAEGTDFGVGTESEPNLDTRETEGMQNTEEDTITVQ